MRDEVDRLIAAWKAQRPDLDLSPLGVLSRITRISRHLDIERRNAFADLDTWGFDVLASLRRRCAISTFTESTHARNFGDKRNDDKSIRPP